MMIELFIPGEPMGKQRPRVFPVKTRGGLIIRRGVTPEKTMNYEVLVRELFAVNYPGFSPLEGSVVLELDAFLGIPKSASGKKRAGMEAGEIVPERCPDLDNILKTIMDALQGFAYRNNSQITEVRAGKRYSRTPGVRVVLRRAEQL